MNTTNNIAQIVIIAVNPAVIGAARPEEGQAGDPVCGRYSVVS